MTNKELLKSRVEDLITGACYAMHDKINKAINSGAIDVDSWDPNDNGMILPKIITIALMEDEALQYYGKGTSFEKVVKKEVNNLKLFL